MNDELYVNAIEVMELIDCMILASQNMDEINAFEAVNDMIVDLKWRKIKA